MADPLTHSFIGAAICPDNPILGAAFSMLPDVIQAPMNVYTFARYRKFAVGSYWHLAPQWMRDTYDAMHGIFIPAALAIYAWMFMPKIFPYLFAYCSHALLDPFYHSGTTVLYPVVKSPVQGWDKNRWNDKLVTILSLYTSFIFMAIRLGWI